MDQYIGKLLDNRYELLERIGNGGMAVVYKARCHRLNRLVAVKILKPELADDSEFRRRFHDESQAVAMLSHPNIVAVYDVSRSDNLDYIVMELIDGITLKQYMQKRGTPLNWREALHFITQIVKALGHAHSRGIVHRDIKPHNVMVLRDGSVKVADFGIARLLSAAQSTLTQEALGSVHYISPEQAKGSHIDGRSDIYSAGVVLYEMITGRLPYEGETPVSVAIQHINSIPIPPRELNSELPEALEAITLKAMAPSPDQRYASADEMLADLEEFRKNPNISFEYSPADLHVYDEKSNEPTQVVSAAHIRAESDDSIRRRRHQNEAAARHKHEVKKVDYDDYDDEPRRGGGVPAALIAVVIILLFIGGVMWFLWNNFAKPILSPAETFEVPSLVGMTMDEIYKDTSITDVWKIELSDNYVATNEYEYGQVARQEPASGTTVKENNLTITVFLSSGEDDGQLRMPPLMSRDYRAAWNELIGMGLVVERAEENSESINSEHVIRTDPAEGTVVEPGQTVIVVVSIGPLVEPVTMPRVEGQTLERAKEMIEEVELVLSEPVIEVPSDDVEEGRVVMQSIPAGDQVTKGALITLQVSTGPARPIESETPSPEPSPTTSESPEEPSVPVVSFEEPTDPPRTANAWVAIDLSRFEGSVQVRVDVGGVPKYNQTRNANEGRFNVMVGGSGTQLIEVYYDGVLENSYTQAFTD